MKYFSIELAAIIVAFAWNGFVVIANEQHVAQQRQCQRRHQYCTPGQGVLQPNQRQRRNSILSSSRLRHPSLATAGDGNCS